MGTPTNGEPWFVGKDVARALGYAKPENAIAAHVDEEDKNITLIQGGIPGNPNQTIINESGLYSLHFFHTFTSFVHLQTEKDMV